MFISDGGTSVIVGDRGVASPKRVGGRGHGLREYSSIIRVSETLFHVFHRFGIFYTIDENIKRLHPPPPQFLLSVERITKLILKKCGVRGEGHIIMIFGHLS